MRKTIQPRMETNEENNLSLEDFLKYGVYKQTLIKHRTQSVFCFSLYII